MDAESVRSAEVVGLDLAPANLSSYVPEFIHDLFHFISPSPPLPIPARTPPANCRFECDDVNLGLLHYKNAFDVVHARCCCSGFGNYRNFLDDVSQVLRPGGVFLSLEGDLQLYDANFEPIVAENESEPVSFFDSTRRRRPTDKKGPPRA